MTDDVKLSYSRTFPADVEQSFDELLPFDLNRLLSRRCAAIPPIKAVRDQAGPWAWTVHPAGRLGSLAMPLFRRMWQGYARQGFDNIEGLLVR